MCCHLIRYGRPHPPTWPGSRAPPVSTPDPACAVTCDGALTVAWTRWPRGARTWSSTSGGCKKPADSSPPGRHQGWTHIRCGTEAITTESRSSTAVTAHDGMPRIQHTWRQGVLAEQVVVTEAMQSAVSRARRIGLIHGLIHRAPTLRPCSHQPVRVACCRPQFRRPQITRQGLFLTAAPGRPSPCRSSCPARSLQPTGPALIDARPCRIRYAELDVGRPAERSIPIELPPEWWGR